MSSGWVRASVTREGREGEGKGAEEARIVAERALRRLSLLEYLILLAAVVLALLGGALVGWILKTALGSPFRIGWSVSSLLLFTLPGGTVYLRELRRDRKG